MYSVFIDMFKISKKFKTISILSMRYLQTNKVKCSHHQEKLESAEVATVIDYKKINFKTKVPLHPNLSSKVIESNNKIEINEQTIKLLERLALVNLESEEALKNLKDSIEFGSKILDIDTTDVEPLYTVLENLPLRLRADDINDGNCQSEILRNASVTDEEYFVAPPGNIPLQKEDKDYYLKKNE